MNDRGIWTLSEASVRGQGYVSAQLAEWLCKFFDRSLPVYDLGCGNGFYSNRLASAGFKAVAYEGTPGVEKIAVFKPIQQLDLSLPAPFTEQHNTLCLEVGEHIPAQFEDVVLSNICKAAKDIVLSWAVVGQPGIGHVNCRSNEWVVEQLERRGFIPDDKLTKELRTLDFNGLSYFKKTIFVFRAKETKHEV